MKKIAGYANNSYQLGAFPEPNASAASLINALPPGLLASDGSPIPSANNVGNIGIREAQGNRWVFGSNTLANPPFAANDPSVLVDIGISALNPKNVWTDVGNSAMVPVQFSSLSGTTGTLSASTGWPYQTSTAWIIALSTGQVITGCTLTTGSTAVTFGSAITGSPAVTATASIWQYFAGIGSSAALSNVTGFNPGGVVSFAFTAAPTGTSATLSANWAYASSPTNGWPVVFSDGEVRNCQFANGATTCTWTGALTGAPGVNATAQVSNSAGRIQAQGFDGLHGAQGTIYVNFQRPAIAIDQNQSTSSQWDDSMGNLGAAYGPSYPPNLFLACNEAVNAQLVGQVNPGSFIIQQYGLGATIIASVPTGGATVYQTELAGATYNSTCELIFSWAPTTTQVAFTAALASGAAISTAVLVTPWTGPTGTYNVTLSNGQTLTAGLTKNSTAITGATTTTSAVSAAGTIPTTTWWVYLDYSLLNTGIFGPNTNQNGTAQIQNGQFYYMSIGNYINGTNTYFGGTLGPYNILRFQVSSAAFPPPVSDCTIGLLGDSYTAGGTSNSGGVFPGQATPGILYNDAQTFLIPDQPGTNGPGTGISATPYWNQNLQAYSCKQLGYFTRVLGAGKAGYSSYFTGGYSQPMATPTPQMTFTAALSGATSGTLATVTVNGVAQSGWAAASGPYFVTFPSGAVRLCSLTHGATTCTWTGAVTDALAATNISTAYTTGYWDALNAWQPELIIYWCNVNNLYECPNTTGAGITPVADDTYLMTYLANGNPKLRAIIYVEMMSLENLPSATYSSVPTVAQAKVIAAAWRQQTRAAFNNGSATAAAGSFTVGSRNVPVVYVPTYESMAGNTSFSPYGLPAQSVTSSATFTTNSQAFQAGSVVQMGSVAPGGFTAGASYYVLASSLATNTVQLSATAGGTAIVATTATACTLYPQQGPMMLLGSHPLNWSTSGSGQGPNSASPNIHPCADGQVRVSDLIWPVLKPYLVSRYQWNNV